MKIITTKSVNDKKAGCEKLQLNFTANQVTSNPLNKAWMGNHFIERSDYYEEEISDNTRSTSSIDALGGYFNENF